MSGPPAEAAGPSACNVTSVPFNSGPLVLTVATSLPEAWPLGLSAALHGLPLVVLGLGQDGWSWRDGNARKIALVQSGLKRLQALVPRGCCQIVYADATDAVLANPPAAVRWPQRAGTGLADDAVLLSAECNSYPRCYARQYRRQAAYLACSHRSATCFANSGLYAGGSIWALRRFVDRWSDRFFSMERSASTTRAERGNDQSALHRLLLDGSTPNIRVDDASEVMLSLYPCQGKGDLADVTDFSRRCFARAHDPMRELGLWQPLNLSVGVGGGGTTGSSAPLSVGPMLRSGARPLLVHANGDHARLHWPALTPLLAPLAEPAAALLEHPVLLLDSVYGGCQASTLRQVMGPQLERAQPAAAPRRRGLRRARLWLAAAERGYCAPTSGGAGDCEHGNKGSWPLEGLVAKRWADAAAACLRRCARCPRCRYVSLSLWSRDCSWFARCDTSRLANDVAGFRTGRAIRAAAGGGDGVATGS